MTVDGPLGGIRVLDLTQSVAGPLCTRMLADMGAEVIKVERPGHGDLGRALEPFVPKANGDLVSGRFVGLNRNKRSIAVDLKSATGREIVTRLSETVDVFVESFRPGVTARLGLGYETLRTGHPELVYASISGFGQPSIAESPFSDRPAFDLVAVALSGLMDLTGETDGPPQRPGTIPLGDLVPALFCTIGTVAALRQSLVTGQGCHVDAAMYDSMVALMERPISHYSFSGRVLHRNGGRVPQPYGVFEAADGHVVIAALNWDMWRRLFEVMGRPDLSEHPDLQSPTDRYAAYSALVHPEVVAWCASRSVAEVERALLDGGVPVASVQDTADLFECPHIEARDLLPKLAIEGVGTFRVPGMPTRFSSASPPPVTAAPDLGEHTDEILTDTLGLDAPTVEELRREGVVA